MFGRWSFPFWGDPFFIFRFVLLAVRFSIFAVLAYEVRGHRIWHMNFHRLNHKCRTTDDWCGWNINKVHEIWNVSQKRSKQMWTLAVQSGSVFNASPDPLTFILNGSKWWCLVGKFSLKCCDGCPFMLICLDLCVCFKWNCLLPFAMVF